MISHTKTWKLEGDKLTMGMLRAYVHEMGDVVSDDTIVAVSSYNDQRDGQHFTLSASVTTAGSQVEP